MASTSSLFYLPPPMIRPSTVSTALKAKRPCTSSFFITDILGNRSRSPPPPSISASARHKNHHLGSTILKDGESVGEDDDDDDDDDTMIRDSDENGKRSVCSIVR